MPETCTAVHSPKELVNCEVFEFITSAVIKRPFISPKKNNENWIEVAFVEKVTVIELIQ